MTLPAVTFSVQVGSDGFNVARDVATELGYRYYDWQITSKAASLVSIPVESSGARDMAERMMDRLSAATMLEEEVPAGFITPAPSIMRHALHALASQEYRTAIEEVICQLAAQGNAVIVGHASQFVLRDWPSAFKVLIRGSFDRRSARLAGEQQSELSEAMKIVTELDEAKREFLAQVYHADWLDASYYDLTINTDNINAATAAEMVVTAVNSGAAWPRDGRIAFIKRFRASEYGRTHLETEVNGSEAAA